MSKGLEILRRLLLASGAIVAAIGFLYAATVAFTAGPDSGDDAVSGAISMVLIPLAFWGYRAAVNWILMYQPPPQSPQPPAEF